MSLEIWLAFTAASAIMLLIPGPTILLVVSYALGQGWRAALPLAAGVTLGDFTAMTLSLLGVGALLKASATVFSVLQWAGAAYLVYLGVKLFRAAGPLEARPEATATPAWRMLTHAWLVTALNPKSLTFFLAFVPQFIDPARDYLTQVLVLETTFLILASLNAFGYALAASKARGVFGNAAALRWINRGGGALLIGAGVATAARTA